MTVALSQTVLGEDSMCAGERRLWRAVLGQAYEDAEAGKSCGDSHWESVDCERARRYLRADSPYEAANLSFVCEAADVPMDRVVHWARGHYAIAA
jgi:hypothetical protein